MISQQHIDWKLRNPIERQKGLRDAFVAIVGPSIVDKLTRLYDHRPWYWVTRGEAESKPWNKQQTMIRGVGRYVAMEGSDEQVRAFDAAVDSYYDLLKADAKEVIKARLARPSTPVLNLCQHASKEMSEAQCAALEVLASPDPIPSVIQKAIKEYKEAEVSSEQASEALTQRLIAGWNRVLGNRVLP